MFVSASVFASKWSLRTADRASVQAQRLAPHSKREHVLQATDSAVHEQPCFINFNFLLYHFIVGEGSG